MPPNNARDSTSKMSQEFGASRWRSESTSNFMMMMMMMKMMDGRNQIHVVVFPRYRRVLVDDDELKKITHFARGRLAWLSESRVALELGSNNRRSRLALTVQCSLSLYSYLLPDFCFSFDS